MGFFCHDEPGVYVVLSGTGSIEHLEATIASFARRLTGPTTRERTHPHIPQRQFYQRLIHLSSCREKILSIRSAPRNAARRLESPGLPLYRAYPRDYQPRSERAEIL